MPALGGGDIHRAFVRSDRLGDPPAAQQPAAVVGTCSLTRSNPIFCAGEPNPVMVQRSARRWGERAHLHADLGLLLAEPVPIADTHRLDRERAPRPDHDALLLGLDTDNVQRLLLAADFDPAALADREV